MDFRLDKCGALIRVSMGKIVRIFQDYIKRLRACWPGGIVTLGLAVFAAGLGDIFPWVARQPDLGAPMPAFIGLLLLAGILYPLGVFLVGRVLLGATALLLFLAA